MPRTSKYAQLTADQQVQKTMWRAGLYVRLSREDGDKEESDSIGNQRSLLQEYIAFESDITIHDIYIDDGYSGTNFERPSFQRMMDDLKSHVINCVVVKDLKGYASIGYRVRLEGSAVGLDSDMIYDQLSFQPRFLQDMEQARQSIRIVSPYVTMKRVRWLEAMIQSARQRRVDVTVITRPAASFDGRSKELVNASIALLRDLGVQVICQGAIHQKYAIIDDRIVWYGSINLLSFGASEESMMRLISGSVARALIGKERLTTPPPATPDSAQYTP